MVVASGVPPSIVSSVPDTATVVSFAFTLYVVTPAVVVVSVSTVVLIPLATFTASFAAAFANSVTLPLPSSDKLLKFLSTALSTLLRVALSRPKVTNPSAPVVIDKPDLGPSVVTFASVAAVKFKPFFNFTVFAAVSATPFARYVMSASKLDATTFALPKLTVPLSPVLPGVIVTVFVPFLMTKSVLPSPAISFIPDNLSDNLTTNPLAPVVPSFSTRIFVFAVVDV